MLVNQRVKDGAMTNEVAYNEIELIIELIKLNKTCPWGPCYKVFLRSKGFLRCSKLVGLPLSLKGGNGCSDKQTSLQ